MTIAATEEQVRLDDCQLRLRDSLAEIDTRLNEHA